MLVSVLVRDDIRVELPRGRALLAVELALARALDLEQVHGDILVQLVGEYVQTADLNEVDDALAVAGGLVAGLRLAVDDVDSNSVHQLAPDTGFPVVTGLDSTADRRFAGVAIDNIVDGGTSGRWQPLECIPLVAEAESSVVGAKDDPAVLDVQVP